jgi:hypothetical protein
MDILIILALAYHMHVVMFALVLPLIPSELYLARSLRGATANYYVPVHCVDALNAIKSGFESMVNKLPILNDNFTNADCVLL